MNMSPPPGNGGPVIMSTEEKMEADARSIYADSVDYGATAEELEAHFHGCGSVNRVTILCDKFSGHPKGFAYIEFSDKKSVRTSLALDESLFRGNKSRWSQNVPTDQAPAQQTGVSRKPDTVPGPPTTTVPALDSTVVLTAGPGVPSTGAGLERHHGIPLTKKSVY